LNPGQLLDWLAFLASLTAGLAWLAAVAGGSPIAGRVARVAFRIQWLALSAAAAFLWWVMFRHDFHYQYVASYSSFAMPAHYIFAAFWGGQEGTFLLWALLTATLGLVLMRLRHPLTETAMAFLNLPLVMLGLVSVMRGPFLMFPPGRVPPDGQGLNPLLQDPWMTIHPPVLFIGFAALTVPFAIAMAAMVRRDWDGWVKAALPWVALSTAVLATGFVMGGVWAYRVLGWGGYWGWDPVENGSLIPWLANVALLHGLLVQRVTGSLRRTNLFLAVTSYVLVLYSSFLTRSGVLADFSVHSFANLGLTSFLLTFLFGIMIAGYGLLVFRLREIPGSLQRVGGFSRESMMWLGQLVLMFMCLLIAVGMSAPLITRLFGPPSNVQTSYYNLVNAPLAIIMGLLLGIGPLMRWRRHDPQALLRAALPALALAVALTLVIVVRGVRDVMPAGVIFAAIFALAANTAVAARGFRIGWRHGVAALGHMGVAMLLVGVVASSGYGVAVQVQLPQGEERQALGYSLTYQGRVKEPDGKGHVRIAVNSRQGRFEARPALYWSEFNQGFMKKPHVERYLTHDVYISPLELVGEEGGAEGDAVGAVWLAPGETRKVGSTSYTFEGIDPQMGQIVRLAARLRVELNGRTTSARPVLEINTATGSRNSIPAYLPGGSSVEIADVEPGSGRVALVLPGGGQPGAGDVLAVELSTKPFINLVWLGSILMLASTFLIVFRRTQELEVVSPAEGTKTA
jgi:cytochrome c-type biogenesis protein CcmF